MRISTSSLLCFLLSPLLLAMAQPSYVIKPGETDNQATGQPSYGPVSTVQMLAPLVNITTDGKDLNLRPERVPPGQFRIRCRFSHSLKDDPIIYPNQPGASHEHNFFGSRDVNAFSTDARKLVGTPSSCFLKADAAAYWFPILYQRRAKRERNGTFLYDKITPQWNLFYYRTGIGKVEDVKPFPQGFTMVAGNPKAGTKKVPGVAVEWWCGTFGKHFPNFPSEACKGNSALIAKLNFPWCWDGKNLQSPDGRSHMAYAPLNSSCPPAFPVPLPRISLKVYYPVRQGFRLTWPSKGRAANPPVYLSTFDSGGSGSGFEYHSDFMNGWDAAVLEELVRECINKNQKCRVISDEPIPPNPFDDGPSCGGKACD